ncbi:MAG: insulinase family protein [Bacteroidetes bacterium]|nr:MAG: insulinase family protein [Bacteroidota bacterium]
MQIEFQTFFLDNGLKVIVHEDHSIPKAVLNLIYRVGSRDEDPDLTGFAHLFEHLMFEGSRHIPHYDLPLQRVGGENNAFTTPDITNYYLSLPSHQIETGFWLESDRMLALDFSQEKLDIQKRVVIEEYKQRYLNQPYGDAHLRLVDLHFTTHPYRWQTIGKDISHIEQATLADVEAFFYGYYAPNNATLVVAGDVHLAQVQELAQKWFGDIPRRELKKHPLPEEPEQTEARDMTVHGDVPYPAVYKMYHIPSHRERDYYIADLLTDLLANGQSSLLHQELTRKQQLSPNASAFSWGLHDPGMLSINATLAPGKSPEAYEQALAGVLAQLQDLNEVALQRIKGKLEATFVLQKTTILNKAIALAISDALGDPDLINTTPEIYRNIALDEVHQAARTILAPENCSTLYYLPN